MKRYLEKKGYYSGEGFPIKPLCERGNKCMDLIRPRELLSIIRRYRKVYANWPSVLWAVHRRSGSVRVRLRMGPELKVPYFAASGLSFLADIKGAGLEEVRGDLAKLRLPEGISLWVRLDTGFDVGHLYELFVDRAYGSSFSGTVVDVGASNGDSAIFFALNGAERVVALEPDPDSFALAEENVRINGLEGRIRLISAALAAEDGEAEFLVPEGSPNAAALSPTPLLSRIVGFGRSTRVRVRTMSLGTLMRELGLDNASLLKMDCEGCEYEVLRSASSDLLARFRGIVLEYHDGPQDLPGILKSAGFSVSCSKESGLGILRAERLPCPLLREHFAARYPRVYDLYVLQPVDLDVLQRKNIWKGVGLERDHFRCSPQSEVHRGVAYGGPHVEDALPLHV